jgi:hypothetical protein
MLYLVLAAILVQPVSPSAPLAGPAATPRAERPTLVRRDFNQRLRRPETTPERAAINLLTLSPESLAAAESVLDRRAAAIDRFVTENLFLLQELDTASRAGDKLDFAIVLLRAVDALRPVLAQGTLRDQVAAALPPADSARFTAIFDEYWSAAVDETHRHSREAGKREARWAADLGERFKHLGEEITRSFERQLASGTVFVDYFLHGLDLTDDQRGVINGLKLDMLERTDFKPTEKDQQQLAVGALAYLSAAQRAIVIKRITGK